MLVRLKRNFFLGGSLFVASRFGTEIPEEVEGKPVVKHDAKKTEGCWVLPPDAEILDAPPPQPTLKDATTTFSKMANETSKPRLFADVMKDVAEL